MASRFRRAFQVLTPSWLAGGPTPAPGKAKDGYLTLYSLGVIQDAFAERAFQGLLARFPSHATASALKAIGRDRRIVRGVNESVTGYAARLIQWRFPRGHRVRGNPFALLSQINAYLQAPVTQQTVDRRGNWYQLLGDGAGGGTELHQWDLGNWDWDGAPASPRWARYWIVIYSVTGTPWSKQTTWGAPGLKWGQAGKTWGTTATPDDVAAIRAITREWKPSGTKRETIIIAFDAMSFLPGSPEPDGNWANYGKDVAGTRVRARLSTARYWYF